MNPYMFNKGAKRENVINLVIHLMYKSAFYCNYRNKYRFRANKRPLLIRPPLWQNSNKTPLFCSKSPLFGAFSGKNWENSNIPPLKTPQSFIERRSFNSADTVLHLQYTIVSYFVFFIQKLTSTMQSKSKHNHNFTQG